MDEDKAGESRLAVPSSFCVHMQARHSLNVRACLGEPYEFQIEVHHIDTL